MELKREVWKKNSDDGLVWAGSVNEPCTVAYLAGEEVSDDLLLEHGLVREVKAEPAKKAAAPVANKAVKEPANDK